MTNNVDHDDVADDGELFAREMEQHYGPPEPGDYAIELMASRGITLTGSRSGAVFLWFTVRFLEGPRRGRELRLSIVVDGPHSMAPLVRRGLKVLDDWRSGTRTPRRPSYVSLLRDIARNSRRLNVVATFGRATVAADGTVIPTLAQDPDRRSAALMSGYEFTLMQSAEAGIAAKTATRAADGTISWKPYDNVKRWWMHPGTAAGNEEMAGKLRILQFAARTDDRRWRPDSRSRPVEAPAASVEQFRRQHQHADERAAQLDGA